MNKSDLLPQIHCSEVLVKPLLALRLIFSWEVRPSDLTGYQLDNACETLGTIQKYFYDYFKDINFSRINLLPFVVSLNSVLNSCIYLI